MKLLETTVSFVLDSTNIDNLKINKNGTSRVIVKIERTDDTKESIVVLNFNSRHTKHLVNSNLSQQILFINGIYQILKNKKDIPFIEVKVKKVIAKNKKEVVDINNLRRALEKEFEMNDLEYLKNKYKEVCCYEEIKGLKNIIEHKKCLQLKSQINTQEISKLKKEMKIYKMKNKN